MSSLMVAVLAEGVVVLGILAAAAVYLRAWP
jgi:hypothetical protein